MPDLSESKTIGLFGGTFDPVHKGHLSIIRSFLNSGYIDFLIVMLTPDPPHKDTQDLTGYAHRLNMLQAVLKEIPNLSVSTVEKDLPAPSYTLNTVRFFSEKYPGHKLYLCLGEDSLQDFRTWHKWQDILDICFLLVAKRPDSSAEVPENLRPYTKFVEHEPVDISSSEARKKIMAGMNVSDILPEEVITYIQKHNLYIR